MKKFFPILVLALGFSNPASAQTNNAKPDSELQTYLIERVIPGAGDLTPNQLKGVSQQSCTVIKAMGPQIEWLHSYVSDNKVYCIYKAANEALIREHAEKGGFPVNRISLIEAKISPKTAGK